MSLAAVSKIRIGAFQNAARTAVASITPIRSLSTEETPINPPGSELRYKSYSAQRKIEVRTPMKLPTRKRIEIANDLRELMPKYGAIGSRNSVVSAPKQMLRHTSRNLTLETMMAAGMHLGHSKSLWNPLNLSTIFGERNGIHIINLEHTMAALRRASQVIKNVAYKGGIILFVGTRKDHQQFAMKAAVHSNQYYIAGRWVPGTITNPQPLLGKHVLYMEEVWDVEEASDFVDYKLKDNNNSSKNNKNYNRYMKQLEEEKAQLERDSDMLKTYMPDLIVALNPLECQTMLAESRLRHVPTIGIVDTNCDPRIVTYSIPCNDDSARSVSIVAGVLGRAAKEGLDVRKMRLSRAAQGHIQMTNEITSKLIDSADEPIDELPSNMQ